MKHLHFAFIGLALTVAAGCSTSATTTAPSNNPDKPNAARSLKVSVPIDKSIKQNGTTDVDVSISRTNFAGPVSIELKDLPEGVSIVTQDKVIPAGKTSLVIALKAAADAKVQNDKKIQVSAKATEEKDMPADVVPFTLAIKPKE